MRRLFFKQVHRIHVEGYRKPFTCRDGQRRVGQGYQPVGAALEGELHVGAEHLHQVDFEVRGRGVAGRRASSRTPRRCSGRMPNIASLPFNPS